MESQRWGPSDQQASGPQQATRVGFGGVVFGLFGLMSLAFFARAMFGGTGSVFSWMLGVLVVLGLARFLLPILVGTGSQAPELSVVSLSSLPAQPAVVPVSQSEHARQRVLRAGGGAYLGQADHGRWVVADRESAVMVLGPPRSGKTSAVMIPAVMAASGPVVATSTKPDVMLATVRARSEIGRVWLFDPSASEDLPQGVRPVAWSPVAAAATWDDALCMARAMTAASGVALGTRAEAHWTERAGALLAPLLYAANLTGVGIEGVLGWTLQQNLAPAMEILGERHARIPADVLVGIHRTEARERSSIFSATAGVLAAYNSDGARAMAAGDVFDPDAFAASHDTIYITAPEHKQALCAPLIVGLLEQIRHATYRRARNHGVGDVGMLWVLDEVANIAPINDLPALVSQAGGQGLQVMVGLQDLSQARTRWGHEVAEGFMSLFQTKVILSGIAEPRTLESISLSLGEYDRELTTTSTGTNHNGEFFSAPGRSEGTSYLTQRQRVLSPGEIARLPDGQALLLQGVDWQLIRLTRWYETQPWKMIAQNHISVDGV